VRNTWRAGNKARHLMLNAGSFINPKNTPYIALSNRPYQWYLTPSFYLKMEKHFQSDNGQWWNNLSVIVPYYYLKSLKESSYQTFKINVGLKPFWSWDSNWEGQDSLYSTSLQTGWSRERISVGQNFLHTSRPPLGPTHPLTKWVLHYSQG